MGIRSEHGFYGTVQMYQHTYYIIKEAKLFIDVMEGMALIQGKFPSLQSLVLYNKEDSLYGDVAYYESI